MRKRRGTPLKVHFKIIKGIALVFSVHHTQTFQLHIDDDKEDVHRSL